MGSSTPLITILGTQPPGESPRVDGEACGFSVAGGVQLNPGFDSVPDLLIGSPLFNVNAESGGNGQLGLAGRVRAFSGRDAALFGIETPLLDDAPPNGTLLVGEHGADQFGNSVAGVHSIDGDSFDDVLVGAWNASIADGAICDPPSNQEVRRTYQGGMAILYSGSSTTTGNKLVVFYGERARDHLGRAVAAMDLFGPTSASEFILPGVAWTPIDQTNPTELGRVYVWNGDSVLLP
jgi:hypothetical protein